MEPTRDKSAKRREIEAVYPELTWFFRIPPSEIVGMPRWLKEVYVDALPRLIAGHQLRAIEAASFPHMEEGTQRDIQNRYRNLMPTQRQDALQPKNLDEVKLLAAMSGIGVVVEPKVTPAEGGDNDA